MLAWHSARRQLALVEEAGSPGTTKPAVERVRTRLDVELAHEAPELLRSIAAFGTHGARR